MLSSRTWNRIWIVSLLVPLVVIAVWGSLLRPLEVYTCVARGGRIVGEQAPDDV